MSDAYEAGGLHEAIRRASTAGPNLIDEESDEAMRRPVVAVTPHSSYTFAIDAAEWDGVRIVLRLREIGRAT